MSTRLKRLTLHSFRDVAPETELRFNDGWNVVLGRNATGKTTLLHVISMALRGDFTALRDEAFDLSYDLATDDSTLTLRVTNVRVEPPVLHGPLAIEARLLTRHSLRVSGAFKNPQEEKRFSFPSHADGLGSLPLADVPEEIRSWLGVWIATSFDSFLVWSVFGPVFRFDEGLGLFRTLLLLDDDGVGLPEGTARGFRVGDFRNYAGALRLPASTWRREPAEGTPSAFQQDLSACGNLRWAREAIEAEEFLVTYPVVKVEKGSQSESVQFGAPTVLVRRADGSSVSVARLSFGQKRLFAFAWYLDSQSGPVVADELVNGMHYEWIERCVEAMEGRQVFVTAQNPLLLDHAAFSAPEDVTRSFVLCRAERAEQQRTLRWTHPSPEQAREFFRAYENGILRVHEILRTEGLW